MTYSKYIDDDYPDEEPLCRKCWSEYMHCECSINVYKEKITSLKSNINSIITNLDNLNKKLKLKELGNIIEELRQLK